jgi:hypothetical protein
VELFCSTGVKEIDNEYKRRKKKRNNRTQQRERGDRERKREGQ